MRAFLHSQDLKWRKIAAIPVPPKKTIEEHVAAQKEFLDTSNRLVPPLSNPHKRTILPKEVCWDSR